MADETNTTTQTPETTQTAPDNESEKLRAKLDKAAKEVEAMKAAEKKRIEDEKARKSKADTDKAIEEGKAKEELERIRAEFDRTQKELEDMKTANLERINAMIERLPEASKAKIDLIKDDLSIAKLEKLVSAEIESITTTSDGDATITTNNPPPTTNPGGKPMPKKKSNLSEDAKQITDMLDVDTGMHESAEVWTTPKGERVWRLPMKTMIEAYKKKAVVPSKLTIANARARTNS